MFCDSGNCRQINKDTIHIRDAVIEDIVSDRNHMLVTISYLVMEDRINVAKLITLVVNQSTVVQDRTGSTRNPMTLSVGMRVNTLISTRMTRSIPPQTRAYVINVIGRYVPPTQVKTGRIIAVDQENSTFTIGIPWNINEQIIFNVSDETIIFAKNGQPIDLQLLLPEMRVRVEHAAFQTLSIPPQTTAYRVQVL